MSGSEIKNSNILSKIKILSDTESTSNYISKNNEDPLLVITENQDIFNYFCKTYDNIINYTNFEPINKNHYLCKEHKKSKTLKNKKIFGVIFTNKIFEEQADYIVERINKVARAYKIF